MTTLEQTPGSEQHPKPDTKYHTNVSGTLRKIDSGPSVAGAEREEGAKKNPRQVPVDLIEEEGMESFPASDPPGHLRSHTTDHPEPHRPTDDDV